MYRQESLVMPPSIDAPTDDADCDHTGSPAGSDLRGNYATYSFPYPVAVVSM
jgi:hypothetical protein